MMTNRLSLQQLWVFLWCFAGWLSLPVRAMPIDATTIAPTEMSTDITQNQTLIRFVVGFEETEDVDWFYQAIGQANVNLTRITRFSRTHAMAASIPFNEFETVESLATLHSCSYFHEDDKKYLMSESTPYGVELVQGTSTRIPMPDAVTSLDDCFKVCLIDSGLAIDHPDIPFEYGGTNIKGKTFGLSSDINWYEVVADSYHGTHVTGTIFAEGDNDIGVVGIIPDNQGVGLLVARVFDETGTNDASYILEAVEWCADQGAKVINLSLGRSGGGQVREERAIYSSMANEGILVVAAAGNDGTSEYSYPASYPFVLSIAAVNDDMERAVFSQYNDMVDLSAPGVSILSTTISNEDTQFELSNGNAYTALLMEGSPELSDVDTNFDSLDIMDCGLALTTCENADGKICLIKRGDIQFTDKSNNCYNGGGVAAVIYNNIADEILYGYVGSAVSIPTFAITLEEGNAVAEAIDEGVTASMTSEYFTYSYESGTSMSTPHVTGVIAKAWAARPECTRAQMEEALLGSTIELGDSDEYGAGLVQAYATYKYLLDNFEAPCGMVGVETDAPTSAPTRSPTNPPTQGTDPPTSSPTKPPTTIPLTAFTNAPSEGTPSSTVTPTVLASEVPSLTPSATLTNTISPTTPLSGTQNFTRTIAPTATITLDYSQTPTTPPTETPSLLSTSSLPTATPVTVVPSTIPTSNMTLTNVPVGDATDFPTTSPQSDTPVSTHPSTTPSLSPTTNVPTTVPTNVPSVAPTSLPTISPSTLNPFTTPSNAPSELVSTISPTTEATTTTTSTETNSLRGSGVTTYRVTILSTIVAVATALLL
eukprot:Nitzschia sp. Nitz4//scaffold6_size259037//115506//118046//NITZ4_001071-RA/size259037-augustus-gene-0.290-mRNA-1//1//CDS//3329556884//7123//frame0